VDLVRVDPELQAVVVTNETTDAKRTIFELAGKANRNPIHSVAWSPDGKSVIVAYTWARSVYEQGIAVRHVLADGSRGRDLLALPTAGQNRALGNALWSPDGKRIALWLADGPNNGVYIANADSSGLKRLDNSIPGEWPRLDR
jgi:TolB protein